MAGTQHRAEHGCLDPVFVRISNFHSEILDVYTAFTQLRVACGEISSSQVAQHDHLSSIFAVQEEACRKRHGLRKTP